jgi:hypothetical protein
VSCGPFSGHEAGAALFRNVQHGLMPVLAPLVKAARAARLPASLRSNPASLSSIE